MKKSLKPYSVTLSDFPETLLLWDIDKTLLTTSGVSKEVYLKAFTTLTGRTSAVAAVTDGRAEFDIMRELADQNSLDRRALGERSRLEEVLVTTLEREKSELAQRGRALPGARSALQATADAPAIVQSVLTGNIRRNAATKLGAFGLEEWLDLGVGAYGDDERPRWELVGLARERAVHKYGIAYDRSSTILVGDTPRDVEAGRIGGAKVIAVATGSSSADTLSAAGADCTLESLDDTDRFLRTLAELRRR
ncbi:haloacid dehalogenase-like hydrolase [Nocardia sp. BMG111209]|uniref:HAD family hydrolase n=1 Tax=Nocardia sp. BMG111209 TaxID=1160137 RepID=UPI000374B304|nr:haloacid dehalogenase-like hydrolase [Nocardia sp. BMG111209]